MEIPYWLEQHLPTKCECGGLIINNEELTRRACVNPHCRKHMAYKVEALAKYFGVKGLGPASAEDIVIAHKLKHHLEAVPLIFNAKPAVHLWEVAHLLMVEGHDKDMKPFCEGYQSFEAVFASNQTLPVWFKMMEDRLIAAQKYFIIKAPLSRVVLNVMMTGEVKGYSSRALFLQHLNNKYGGIVQLQDVGVRKTNVFCLIKEETAAYHNKTKIAKERGIKIVTPKQLEETLELYVKQLLGGESSEDR